ncbi:MAG: alpha/beta hydrolase [Desulfobacterium sp.]|nr:alpha/beta hydrolase [Desulfobacterium sp.]
MGRLTLILACLLLGCAAQPPNVRQGEVTYPYKVKYCDAKAGDGTVWNIGYMDVVPMFKPNPKVLVLIHGRSFSGAYFGNAIKVALKHGIRVVVPDLPNYGKSIPGNLDKPITRTIQDTREVINDLIVNQLGIPKAIYGGHSLGGQFVLGYALTYPEAVAGLILVAPAGLEELPAKYFPPHLAKSTRREDFSPIPYYAKKARLAYSKNPKIIEDFYYYKLKINGKPVPSGFFKMDSPDARLATELRKKMITGNAVEFQRYSLTGLRDVFNLGVEIKKEDPSSLFKQYDRIRTPILLIFGDEEPFYPKKISGLKDLKQDIITPFYQRMTSAGSPVAVKLYPGCGHFPHTDLPDEFAKDIVQFVSTGKVENCLNPEEM